MCEIVPYLRMIQPVVSRHLKILKDTGLLRCRKDGTKRFYSVTNPNIYRVIDALTPELLASLAKDAYETSLAAPQSNSLISFPRESVLVKL